MIAQIAYLALATGVAGLLTTLLVPFVRRLGQQAGALDLPGGRRQHQRAVPRLGGIAIVSGFALTAATVLLLARSRGELGIRPTELAALAVGTALIFLLGLIDDIVGVSAGKKLLVQVVAAGLLVQAGWAFGGLRLPFTGAIELGVFANVISVLWIVGVTNAINFLDGLDGLASGVVAIIASSFLAFAVMRGDIFTIALMGSMAGACIGFLRHNWAPAHIFMGDSGSLSLGFVLAASSVHATLKAPAAVAIIVPILALGLPVFDSLLVVATRFVRHRERGLRPRFLRVLRGDRTHLHHLVAARHRRRAVVGGIYLLVLAFCALSLLVAVTRNQNLGLLLLGVEFVVVMAVRRLASSRAEAEPVSLPPPTAVKTVRTRAAS